MTTRKELIIKKYLVLEKELKQYFQEGLFPSLDDVDVGDLVYLLTMTFLGIDSELDYQNKIKELMSCNGLTLSQPLFDKFCPSVIEFIIWLKAL